MLRFIVLFTLIQLSSAYSLIQPRQSPILNEIGSLISPEHCHFYVALNTYFQCGNQSHLLKYSYKYCQRLVNIRNSFSNTQYQDNARRCLQQKLFDKIQQFGQQTTAQCDTFKQLDLESHESCFAASFRTLSIDDIKQFIATFKDTTANYRQLCQLANSFAGHWSQIVNGDLMMFIKQQLREIFPDGDTSSCSIPERNIIEEIVEIVTQVQTVLEKVKNIKEDITTIIEKGKLVRDDFKTIRQIIRQMQNGSISERDGLKEILAKSKAIVSNSKVIIETIKNLGQDKTNVTTNNPIMQGGIQESVQDSKALSQISEIINQFSNLKENVYNVIDNVNTIVDIVNDIRGGEKNITDGIVDIIGQIEQGVDNIYSIIDTSYTLKETAFELIESLSQTIQGAVDNVGNSVNGGIGGITNTIGGGLNGIGK